MKASELIEDALNGRTPTIYDQLDKDTRVINQQETLAARESAAEAQGELQRMGMEGRGARAPPGPATITTRSTTSACAPMTART